VKQYPKPVVFLLLILFHGFSLKALDVGLLLDQDVTVTGSEVENIAYTGALMPHLSGLVGDIGEFIFSASLGYGINPGIFVPELLRTEITARSDIGEYKLGRMPYRDPLGIIAEGLFDGTEVLFDTRVGTFSASGWYTGGLYKKRAFITMTDDEMQSYHKKLDYHHFVNTYFAPGRIFTSLDWEHPSLGGLLNIKVAILGQFDVSGADLHTQYVTAKLALPISYFVFDIGGCFETAEYSRKFNIAMAGEMGFTVMLPTPLENHIALRARYSSGATEGSPIAAFLPLTTIPQGNLLEAKFSGLSILSLNYLSRLYRTVSMDMSSSYFVRNDLKTYTGYPVMDADSGGNFLGAEFFGRVVWNPTSGIQINAGGGLFVPSLGNVAPNANVLWRVETNIVLSIF